jgi:uncharacterized phage-associated protein
MATVFDVAKYILDKKGPMTAMKLQKLVYYSQAWSLVWDDEPLFPEPVQAWANGPVVPSLYQKHRGLFSVSSSDIDNGDGAALKPQQAETVDHVLRAYGDRSAQWLSDQTHREPPWADARRGLPASERSSMEISHAAMLEYYSSLDEQNAVSLG